MDGGTFWRMGITTACSNPLMQTCPFTRKRTVDGRISLCIMPALCMKAMPDACQVSASDYRMCKKVMLTISHAHRFMRMPSTGPSTCMRPIKFPPPQCSSTM
jgi:hypothetical protein